MFNMEDFIFQLVMFLILISFIGGSIGIIVYFIKSSKKKTERLYCIEEKLDELLEKK
jgi:hypothetical protein